ncbi:MAG TPA: hypothetical protein GXZ40_08445 [Bacteroidales bacterium]|jgi:RHS repeat-associated protein|nr:hypothetical protein [Bacteroidales bacterium]
MPHLTSMAWDYLDQLQSASNGTFTSYYNYNAEGNRTRKVVVKNNIIETRYYINGYELYRKENNGIVDFERKTINISDDEKVFVRIEQKTGENPIVRYQYDNHLGSSCLELDNTGQIISYEEYHPFGTTSYRSGRTQTEVSLKRYKYCGKERDEETGLYYYGARYYAGWIGRWISVDPLASERSWVSPYSYCQNNPMNRIDPTGALDWIPPTDGSGNWTAEPGDGYWKLFQQAGIPLEDAKNAVITANQNRGQTRTSETMIYPGDVVNVATPQNETSTTTTTPNYQIPYPASGACESVSVVGTLIDVFIREPIQGGLEYLGMGKNVAYWTSTGLTIVGSIVLAKKISGGKGNIKYPRNDPTKAPKGFQWKGRPGSTPGSKQGNYVNTKTNETLRPDLSHPAPIKPHWDYTDPSGTQWRIFQDGSRVKK